MNNAEVGIIYHPQFLSHTNSFHPERKERLEAIINKLQQKGIWERARVIEPEPASLEQISFIHTPEYIQAVEKACADNQTQLDMDTYINPHSYDTAVRAVGGALTAVDGVMDGLFKSCFALLRPPGHHAEYNRSMGFCIFNNIAIAAAYARQQYGLERILILDWDVHHGNGTQQAFYSEPGIMYISLHQWPAFPGTGMQTEIGKGAGAGYTVNMPLPPGCSDEDYLRVFNELLLPVMDAYSPQLVMVSAGQDAHHSDPLAGEMLSLAAYPAMTAVMQYIADRHAQGRLVLMLEGGYSLDPTAEAVSLIIARLMGDEPEQIIEQAPPVKDMKKEVDKRITTAIKTLSPYWPFKELLNL